MININHLRHCVSIDLETTGVDEKKCAIVSIGAALFTSTDEFYKELVIPAGAVIEPAALEVNGETEAGLRGRTTPEYMEPMQAVLELCNWCKQHDVGVIIGKNPSFDHRFLLYVWEKFGLSRDTFTDIITYRHMDWSSFIVPLMLYKGYTIPREGWGTAAIGSMMKIPDEERPHNAINGARYNVFAVKHALGLYDQNSE